MSWIFVMSSKRQKRYKYSSAIAKRPWCKMG